MSTSSLSVDSQDAELRERAALLSYPVEADHRGGATVVWRGNVFHFGRHNSLASYVEFCEWRRVLVETGHAPLVKDIRVELGHRGALPFSDGRTVLPGSPPKVTKTAQQRRRLLVGSFAVGLSFAIGAGWTARTWNSGASDVTETDLIQPNGHVDRIPLTDFEAEVIRELRAGRNRDKAKREASRQGAKTAERILDLIDNQRAADGPDTK